MLSIVEIFQQFLGNMTFLPHHYENVIEMYII